MMQQAEMRAKECEAASVRRRVPIAVAQLVGQSFISAQWHVLEPSILLGLTLDPKDSKAGLDILRMVQQGQLQVWALYGAMSDEDAPEMFGTLTTMFTCEWPARQRELLVFSWHTAYPIERKALRAGFEPVVDYAQRKGCTGMVLYTRNPKVVSVARRLGFMEDQTVMRKGW